MGNSALQQRRRQPVAAIYDGLSRLLCPHVLAGSRAICTLSCIRLEEAVIAGCRLRQQGSACGVVSRWGNSVRSNTVAGNGARRRARPGKPALMKWISTWTLNLEQTRRTGSESVAAAVLARE